jgi:hypothetical protein
MKPSLEYLSTRISVDVDAGRAYWIDATKHHAALNGMEAGSPRSNSRHDKRYWHVKVDSNPIKRSHIVFLFAHGRWPDLQIDHINGDSLDDRISNLREATATQNAWNHKTRRKRSSTPMGVRLLRNGKYQARIAVNKQQIVIGSFDTPEMASQAYQLKRKEFFNEYA